MSRPARLLTGRKLPGGRAGRPGEGPLGKVSLRDRIWLVAGAMIAAQVAFRAWAVYPAYFYGDDFRLIREGGQQDLGWRYLTSPYDAQFMPYGRFVAWVASRTAVLDWTLVATTTLVAQVAAGLACLWMLVTLFGWRWAVLGPLAIYLSCAMTMPVLMWWAAGLNQVPLQAVFFAAVATWVRYLRGRSRWWLLATFLVLAFGLLCYVKTLLVFPVLAFVALAYFSEGGPVRRVRLAVRTYWVAVLAGLVMAAAFAGYYVTHVPQLTTGASSAQFGDLLDEMLGTSFAVGAFGGPWRWDDRNPPVGLADPPMWAVHACWVLVALVIAYLALRRERTLRAWLMLAAYLAADFALLLTTRAPVVGALTGSEYRYLTDSTCALVLAVSLATMPVRGAVQSSVPRGQPLLVRGVGDRAVVVGVALVAVSGLVSAGGYARLWHTENSGDHFLNTAVATMQGFDEIDLADQDVPRDVMDPLFFPYNRTQVLLPLVSRTAQFPEATDSLHVLTESGALRPVELDVATTSLTGPADGCGYKVTGSGATVPLARATDGFSWWLRIPYLASADSALRVVAGDSDVSTEVFRGLGTLYVHISGGVFDEVRLEGVDPGVTLCVDTIDVGTPVPEGEGS